MFNNIKKYTKNWEIKLDTFNIDWKDNLIIKGDNLEVMKNIKSSFQWKVKLIYIDPPYNTGKDVFSYKDKQSRSDWLSFMKERLEIAKELLRNDWVIFVTLSDKEAFYCKILMDEIFDEENFLADIIWESTKSITNTPLISNSHSHNLVFFKNKSYFKKNRSEFRLPDRWEGFSNPDNDPRWLWKADSFQVDGWRPNQQYEIINPKTWKVYKPNKNCSWKNDYNKFQELLKDNRIVFGKNWDSWPQRKRFLFEALERWQVSKTLWNDIDTNREWTKQLKDLFWEKIFSYPKPEGLLERILQLSTKPGDIVLDFFLGSWTTTAVAHKMWRQYIGIEQMDYVKDITVKRMKKVIEGEQWGISKNVEWKGWGEFIYMELLENK